MDDLLHVVQLLANETGKKSTSCCKNNVSSEEGWLVNTLSDLH